MAARLFSGVHFFLSLKGCQAFSIESQTGQSFADMYNFRNLEAGWVVIPVSLTGAYREIWFLETIGRELEAGTQNLAFFMPLEHAHSE